MYPPLPGVAAVWHKVIYIELGGVNHYFDADIYGGLAGAVIAARAYKGLAMGDWESQMECEKTFRTQLSYSVRHMVVSVRPR